MGSGQITKNQINLDLIEIFKFCYEDSTSVETLGGLMGGWMG